MKKDTKTLAEKMREEEERRKKKEEADHRAAVVYLYQHGMGGSAVVTAYQTNSRLW